MLVNVDEHGSSQLVHGSMVHRRRLLKVQLPALAFSNRPNLRVPLHEKLLDVASKHQSFSCPAQQTKRRFELHHVFHQCDGSTFRKKMIVTETSEAAVKHFISKKCRTFILGDPTRVFHL